MIYHSNFLLSGVVLFFWAADDMMFHDIICLFFLGILMYLLSEWLAGLWKWAILKSKYKCSDCLMWKIKLWQSLQGWQ